jgi:ketosteroid isomerase-like protein
VCLTMLQSRKSRHEESLEAHVPDPVVSEADGIAPEDEALLADSIGLAMLVVLETLTPAERLAFVLHDMFDVPFDDIAQIVGRSPAAARQLASRARRRIKGLAPIPDPDLPRQREVAAAFLAAVRAGDFDALVAVLDPDVVLRADAGAVPAGASRVIHGAEIVAGQALGFSRRLRATVRPVLVNGAPGFVARTPDGRPFSVLGLTVTSGRIVEIDILADPERLAQLDLAELEDADPP